MRRFIVQRLLWSVFVIFGLSLMTFVLSHMVPADPVGALVGYLTTDGTYEREIHRLGLDKPLHEQYLIYVRNMLHLDLGVSIRTRRPVMDDLKMYFPPTAELTITAVLLVILIAIPLGTLSALRRDTFVDHVSRFIALSGVSMPVFWLGVLLQLIFYANLYLLPIDGRISIGIDPPQHITGLYTVDSLLTGNTLAFRDSLKHLILPAITLAFPSMTIITRMTRSSVLDIIRQPYIVTARAKGLTERAIVVHHVLKNALIPVVTLLGLQAGRLLGGAFLVEVIFSWPGMGFYAIKSMLGMDYSSVMGVTLFVATIFLLVNLVVDFLYAFFDPRITYESRS